MLLVIDNQGNVIQNHGTNSAFPDGNIPYMPELPEGHKYVKLHDTSYEAMKVMTSYEYTIDADKKVTVIKTKEQWASEQPAPPPSPKELAIEELKKIDTKSTKAEDILKRLEIIETILFPEV